MTHFSFNWREGGREAESFPKDSEKKKAPDLWRNQIYDIKQRESHEECVDQIIDINTVQNKVNHQVCF